MTITVKNSKTSLIIPPSVRRQAGIKTGDQLEFKVSGRVITIVPKPSAGADDCTPEQRTIVEAQVAEGLHDIRNGLVSPRFDTVDEMLASMKRRPRKADRQKTRP